jgi:DNA-directed RNA polymerase specialized sigma24 family protein
MKEVPDDELLYYISQHATDKDVAEEAFREFFRRHCDNLTQSCRMSLGALNRQHQHLGDLDAAAEELAYEVFRQVHEKLAAKFTTKPKPGTAGKVVQVWLARIASNLARREMVSVLRERGRMVSLDDESAHDAIDESADTAVADDSGEVSAPSPQRRLQAMAFDSLSDDDRRILKLSVELGVFGSGGGFAARQAGQALATTLGIPAATARKRRERALERLRGALKALQEESGQNHDPESSDQDEADRLAADE